MSILAFLSGVIGGMILVTFAFGSSYGRLYKENKEFRSRMTSIAMLASTPNTGEAA